MAAKVQDLESKGYVLLNDPTADARNIYSSGADAPTLTEQQQEVLKYYGMNEVCATHGDGNRAILGNQGGYVAISHIGHEMNTEEKSAADIKVGTPNVGYIKWGADDRLPMHVFHATWGQIYTATAQKFLQDAVYGKGPQFKYRIVRYVNGMIKEEYIDFNDAGKYLEGEIESVLSDMKAADEEKTEGEASGTVVVGVDTGEQYVNSHHIVRGFEPTSYRVKAEVPKTAPSAETDHSVLGTADYRLKCLYEDYDRWIDTKKELDEFLERTNLKDLYMKCMVDDQLADQYVILAQLEQGARGSWDPKIISLEHRPVICCRKEKMDNMMRSNYVYFSDVFRYHRGEILDESNIVAFHALRQESVVRDLKDYISANVKTAINKRELWHAIWCQQDCGWSSYYQIPTWWSIFTSLVFQYVSTFIYDKTIERNNANMASHLIYINDNYMKAYYDEMGANTREKKIELRSQLVAGIDRFLKDKQNNGKSLTLSDFIAPDGKTIIKSIEIVAVPKADTGTTKEDLEECANLIFWARGIHSNLIGSFGKNPSSGGTQQRELYLLKQVMLSPRQQRFIDIINSVAKFNKWDEHLCLQIGREVLSTLDASKTGIVEE